MNYLWYKIYKIMKKWGWPSLAVYNASLLLGFCFSLNIITLLIVSKRNLSVAIGINNTYWILGIIFFLPLIILLSHYCQKKNWYRVIKYYINEPERVKIVGTIGVSLYVLISFVLFITLL